MAGGDSALGGALDFQEWCHLFSLQPLHLTKNFFGFHQHPQNVETPRFIADGYSDISCELCDFTHLAEEAL